MNHPEAVEICFEIEVSRHEMDRALIERFCRKLEEEHRSPALARTT